MGLRSEFLANPYPRTFLSKVVPKWVNNLLLKMLLEVRPQVRKNHICEVYMCGLATKLLNHTYQPPVQLQSATRGITCPAKMMG